MKTKQYCTTLPLPSYYNEFDPQKAAWLRELIKRGVIAPGDVDERSIKDIRSGDLRDYTQCHFFAGIGVWSYALRNAGWPDDREVWTGSCPCQSFSQAGNRRGFADERHLWPDWFRLISKCRPIVVFGEQSSSKDALAWLDVVQSDLEGADYTLGAVDLCAAGCGAPHIRQRLYFVADSNGGKSSHEYIQRSRKHGQQPEDGNASKGYKGANPTNGYWQDADWLLCTDDKYRPVEPGTFPLAHGSPGRLGRLRGYGDAIVAPLATEFVEAYLEITDPL